VVRLLRWLLPRLFRLHVEGLENVPEPPFIIASNHQAWYDTAFLLAALPSLPPAPMVHTMARRDTVFNRGWKRRLMPRLGIFPISPSRGELDGRAVATVYQLLAKGGVVLIFPEGRYSRGRALRPLKKGVAHFALQAGVPICPVALSGLDRPARLVDHGPPRRAHRGPGPAGDRPGAGHGRRAAAGVAAAPRPAARLAAVVARAGAAAAAPAGAAGGAPVAPSRRQLDRRQPARRAIGSRQCSARTW